MNILPKLIVLGAISCCALVTFAFAEADYPVQPIKIVVPVSAGGAPDVMARIVSEKFAEKFNQPVVVENRPGGGERIGAMHVAAAPPDDAAFKQIVDIGGGDGTLLAGLLTSCPDASGTLFDLAPVVAGATGVLRNAGVSGRCAIVAGSFFEYVPSGGDAYLLKYVLHDWDDPEALAILRNCRRAMTGDAKLLIVECIVLPPNEGADGKLSDLNMLVSTGGCERTLDEFIDLLARAKFALEADIVLAGTYRLIEAKRSTFGDPIGGPTRK